MKELRKKVIDLAASLALQESQATGKDYSECVCKALDEACIRLQIDKKEFIKMFL